ncbi:hypothetical protein CEXT_331561, partial [Caerostris extrusa]
HNCVKFGNQHRRSSATLPQCSSGNVAEDIELITAEEMEDEALWPFVKQRIDCEETAATEMAFQYLDTNQNSYNPSEYEIEPSDYLFPDMHYIQEIDLMSTHLQLFPEVSNVFNNQNPQNYESSNSEQPEDTAMSVATRCDLPGFKQTYVNCEKNSEEKSLDRTSCAFENTDAPQKTKNSLYKCSKCSMEFRRKDYIDSHERCHNVEKPYVCSFCDKAFTRSDVLGAHIRTHTGEKPYSCTKCGKCYPYSSSLAKHVRTIHAGETPDPRSESGKSCSNNSLPKCRMPKHADEERGKCDSCGAEFSSEESLEAHKCKED